MMRLEAPLASALSPSEGERENRLQSVVKPVSPENSCDALCCSLSPSDGERVRVRGIWTKSIRLNPAALVQYFIGTLFLVCTVVARADTSETNQPFHGVTYRFEARTNPPTRLFIAEIDLTNPEVRLRVSPAGTDPDGDGHWQTTLMQPTRIAAREGFDLVVNGDFFHARGVKDAEGTNSTYHADVWAEVLGPAMSEGRTWATSTNERPALIVHEDRTVSIENISQPREGSREIIAGNTMLVENSQVIPHQSKTRHPRTAAGLDARKSKLILLVVDGRKPGVAVGMSYDELAQELLRLGCHTAFNLDGGGSSVMAIRNPATREYRILNQPTDGHERPVANVLGVIVGEHTN
ncbi:MAG: phosphodiester glycosidase family protein [Verrucomicrobia bacterium]|nr:MAG: phosphodiester glycosidase family protein [Verrucomicrobiota bacterium]